MKDEKPAESGELLIDPEAVTGCLQKAVRQVLIRHKRLGNPVVEWRDGKIVWVPARDIPVDIPEVDEA